MASTEGIIDLPRDTWTLLNSGGAPVANFTCVHWAGADVILRAMPSSTAPSASIDYGPPLATGQDRHQTGFLKFPIADLDFEAAPTHLFAKALGGNAQVYFRDDAP